MMRKLLKRRTRPNGVFCHNDVVAIGAMKATLDAGLSIPKDIAFVGFDNVRYSKYLQIPLTSVDQSTAQLGVAAAQLALDLIAKKVDKPKTILLAPSLVVRQSTIGDGASSKIEPERPVAIARKGKSASSFKSASGSDKKMKTKGKQ
jgi:DNA-binding LacI/PurR family transcriptional regulator